MTSADPPFSAEVARYLADCAEHAQLLSPAYHPTEDGALKVIWHRGQDQADQVRAAFRAATARPRKDRPAAGQRTLPTSGEPL